jgi:type IV secretory pathway VirB4 component
VFDTDALALAFPLGSADLPAPLPGQPTPPGGVLIGVNPDSKGIIWWDRWSHHNHNTLVLARSGAGKSYLVKLDILRSLYSGVRVAVIDPEDEYPPLAAAVGGVTIALGVPGVRINPLDIPQTGGRSQPTDDSGGDPLTRRALFCHTLIAVLLGEQPPPEERAMLDTAIAAAYQSVGITTDPTTWGRPAPLLADVEAALTASADTAARSLATRLRPWTKGSFKGLFDGPTTTTPTGRLVVWSVRHLPDELRAAGMLIALDAIWRDVDNPTPAGNRTRTARRLVVVDEAWTLLRDAEGARFLYRLAKAARKRHAGLVVVTQDAEDLLTSDLGKAVAANAATQILMRQAPQAIDTIATSFGLTPTETRVLRAAPRGHGLLLGGSQRVTFEAVSSPREHELCRGAGEGDEHTTGPATSHASSHAKSLANTPGHPHDPRQDQACTP